MEEPLVEGLQMAVEADHPRPGDQCPSVPVGHRDVCHAAAPARDPAAWVGAEAPHYVCQRAVQRLLEQD